MVMVVNGRVYIRGPQFVETPILRPYSGHSVAPLRPNSASWYAAKEQLFLSEERAKECQ